MKQISTFLLLIAVFGFIIPGTSRAAAAAADDSTQVSQLIAQGNEFAEKTFNNEKALEKYNTALSLSPENYEILWRLSRTYVDIGEHFLKTQIQRNKNSWNTIKNLWILPRKQSPPIRKELWDIPGKQLQTAALHFSAAYGNHLIS